MVWWSLVPVGQGGGLRFTPTVTLGMHLAALSCWKAHLPGKLPPRLVVADLTDSGGARGWPSAHAPGGGPAGRRYSMLVTDGRIEKFFCEPGLADNAATDPFEVSDAPQGRRSPPPYP